MAQYSAGVDEGPHWGLAGQAGVSGYANLPAAGIILIITALLIRGTKESGAVNAVIVTIKLLIVLFFIAIGIGHIDGVNYHLPAGGPAGMGGYFPFGIAGMLGGAAFIFFAYIGFDAVLTTAEEAKNPDAIFRSESSSVLACARFSTSSSSRF